MNGARAQKIHYKEQLDFGSEILRSENLSGKGFSDVSLSVRAGEVVGLYGLIGAARSEFVQCLFGWFRKTGGPNFLERKGTRGHCVGHRSCPGDSPLSGTLSQSRCRAECQLTGLRSAQPRHAHQPLCGKGVSPTARSATFRSRPLPGKRDDFTGFSRASFLSFPRTDGTTFEVPALFWMVPVVAIPGYVFLNHSRWGRYLLAIGKSRLRAFRVSMSRR
jgi:hypothetical protein